MKTSSRREIAESSACSALLNKGQRLHVADPEIEFGWLASLPIAGAIFRIDSNEIRHVGQQS